MEDLVDASIPIRRPSSTRFTASESSLICHLPLSTNRAPALIGPTGRQHLATAVLDTGSDECLFPSIFQHIIAAQTLPEIGHRVTWRGGMFPLVYADVSLELADEITTYRWPAIVAFTQPPLKYSLLGIAGCLEYFDARF